MNTTIHTIEDLIRLLDDNPEWADALRARLLTRELIELPEKFSQFVAEINKFVEATNRRFDALENRVGSVEEDLGIIKKRLTSIQNDVGMLKGNQARDVAVREAPLIAEDMGLQWTKDLTINNLRALVARADTSGIAVNDLRSFRRADLIIEATDRNGATCYIAVEISYTVNGRDTSRALRNAEFMTRFTDDRCYPAVAGIYRDNRVEDLLEMVYTFDNRSSGKVFWYPLDPATLQAE
jgi:DNA-binding transcriptional MerR regulator